MNNTPLLNEKDNYINKMECSPKTFNELRQIARDRGTAGYWKLPKAYLIEAIIRHDPLIVIETTKDIIVL